MSARNERQYRLESAAERTARSMIRRSDINVVVGGAACYHWPSRTLSVPSHMDVASSDPDAVDAWRGLLDHECAHIEFTDFEVLEAALARWKAEHGEASAARLQSLHNAIEDCWIEPAFSALWPGVANHIAAKNRWLAKEARRQGNATDPTWVHPQDVHKRPVGLWSAFTQAVTRLGRPAFGWTLDDTHPVTRELVDRVWGHIQRGYAATATSEVVDVCDAIWAELAVVEEEDQEVPGDVEDVDRWAGAAVTPNAPLAAEATGGVWGQVENNDMQVLATTLMQLDGYTVHPAARATDKVIRYDAAARAAAEPKLRLLEAAAGTAGACLRAYLRGALQAAWQSITIGAQEEGDEIDPDALASIALGVNGRNVWARTVTGQEGTAYVAVLVDCSGSMGSSQPTQVGGRTTVTTKAGYASVTAMALHKALADLGVEHCVLGYTTDYTCRASGAELRRADGTPLWSRATLSQELHVFVESPGIYDDGRALPYITGRGANLDGESVEWAARYAAEAGGAHHRVVLLVVADGLPAGADDGEREGEHLRATVDAVARAGIEVYGLACGVPANHMRVFAEYYPTCGATAGRARTGSMLIPSGEGMSEAVIKHLVALLTGVE